MSTKSVLVIDDDKLVLGSVTNVFIKNGWTVNACSDGQEGLDHLAQGGYDCVLLDIRMPGMDGTQVLERLRLLEVEKKLEHQKVIIMTGYADEEASIKAFQLGAFNYISKPFDIFELVQKAEACANSRGVNQTFDAPPTDDESEEKAFKKIRKSYEPEDVSKKADLLAKQLNTSLNHIKACSYDTNHLKGNVENPIGVIQIPLAVIGPLPIVGQHAKGDFWVPLATTEGALTLTYDLGARLLKMSGGVKTEVVSKCVHITPMFPIEGGNEKIIPEFIKNNYEEIKKVAEGASNHTRLIEIIQKKSDNNLLLKFVYDTGDAQGLNMINQASFNACKYIQAKTGFRFFHRSHYSGIKHFSPLNEREGQGRVVKASAVLTAKALGMLRVKAHQLKDFFDRCIESAKFGEISSVNVHAANGITGIFLACGQDPADISCAHSCSTVVEVVNENDLKIDVTLHNLMVGTVGGGTGLGTQSECLDMIGCLGSGKSDKFAEIVAATVLAGEFPTAAAVITETYVDIHNKYGRNKNKLVRG